MIAEYKKDIGLEVHIELATKTKIFCGCAAAFGDRPNTHICPLCAGMPGSLPVLNRQVVEYAMAVGVAMNCKIHSDCRFDRKNYFYPDNPQNYQISQLYLPICYEGALEIETPLGKKLIGISELHMEEDAGKLMHDDKQNCSFIDYNRSGVPLIEIVTKPDMEQAEEVVTFLRQLQLLVQYLGVSDGKLQEGSMRVDVNLSVRKVGEETLGTRTEMKNLNSFRAISRAIEVEYTRQVEIIKAGKQVVQETRRFDDSEGISYAMRSKEEASDYRYFPDPDLMPVLIDDGWIQLVKDRQPELPFKKLERFQDEWGLSAYDAGILIEAKELAKLFEETAAICQKPKKAANWILGETFRLMKERKMEPKEVTFAPEHLAGLIALLEQGTINSSIAKEVFEKIFDSDVDPTVYVEEKGLGTVHDEDMLRKVVLQIIAEHPQSVEDYRSGKEKAIGFFTGQTMKRMNGKANPMMVKGLLKELL